MLKNVRLSDISCFTDDAVLDDLTTVNYIYGPNGSGKTSISQFLAEVDASNEAISWSAEAQTVKVYNRDYVRRSFTDGEEPGVFLLGEDSQETLEQIKEIELEITKERDKKINLQSNLEDKRTELKRKERALIDRIWKMREKIPQILMENMRGIKRRKESAYNRVLSEIETMQEKVDITFEELAKKAQIAFSPDQEEVSPIKGVPSISWDQNKLALLLKTPIVTSSNIKLAKLVTRLNSSSWVRDGIQLAHRLKETQGEICPFCQQDLPYSLLEELESLFDEVYQRQIDLLDSYHKEVLSTISHFNKYKEDNTELIGSLAEKSESFDDLITSLVKSLSLLEKEIEDKIQSPAMIVESRVELDSIEKLEIFINGINNKIDTNNEIIRNKTMERKSIVNSAWQVFAKVTLEPLIEHDLKEKNNLEKAIDGTGQRIAQCQNRLTEKEDRLKNLREGMVHSEATILKINKLLELCQFYSFRLEKAENIKNGYKLIRQNGEYAEVGSLSEGERTFLTFLYFYHGLSQVPSDNETQRICVIIDDPISSLDGDIMFVVSALTRDLVAKVKEKKHDRVDQVILMTHSTRFYSEVTYAHKTENSKQYKYYRIRKLAPKPNQIEDCGEINPIRTSYQELWDQVAYAKKDESMKHLWLPNVMRRIIESYFATLGGQSILYEIGDDFEEPERILHHALVAWSHSGSHSVIDGDAYAQPSEPNHRWLRAFERLFTEAADGVHKGHYDMMMSEAERFAQKIAESR